MVGNDECDRLVAPGELFQRCQRLGARGRPSQSIAIPVASTQIAGDRLGHRGIVVDREDDCSRHAPMLGLVGLVGLVRLTDVDFAGALVALGPFEQWIDREHSVVDAGVQVADLGEPCGHGGNREVGRLDIRRSRPM